MRGWGSGGRLNGGRERRDPTALNTARLIPQADIRSGPGDRGHPTGRVCCRAQGQPPTFPAGPWSGSPGMGAVWERTPVTEARRGDDRVRRSATSSSTIAQATADELPASGWVMRGSVVAIGGRAGRGHQFQVVSTARRDCPRLRVLYSASAQTRSIASAGAASALDRSVSGLRPGERAAASIPKAESPTPTHSAERKPSTKIWCEP